MQGTMPGARRRGRPRTAWMDNIKTWTGLSVEESVRMAEDRDKWRKYAHGVANPRIEDGKEQEDHHHHRMSVLCAYCTLSTAAGSLHQSAEETHQQTVTLRLHLHRESKKDTKLLPITSPTVNRFSKCFHPQTQGQICNKLTLAYST